MLANGTQLFNQVRDGHRKLSDSSNAELRKIARALGISISNGSRYFRRDELIVSIADEQIRRIDNKL